MEKTELKLYPCHCGGEIKIEKVAQNGGMDGTYWDWELTCNKCGSTKTYAADDFYGRKYKTFEEVVNDWNFNRKKEKNILDILNSIRADIDLLTDNRCDGTTVTIYSWNGMKRKVFDIIDKYKAESEDK